MNYNAAKSGHFYAIGVGPGSADLVTYRAAKLIETADVIIAPRSRIAEESLALKTVKDLIHDKHEIIDNVYAMVRDSEQTNSNWKQVAEETAKLCAQGKSVVQITIGDPLIYSTSCYLLAHLRELQDKGAIHIVPGISAFQAIAARVGEPLTIQEDRMTLMPATDLEMVEKALKNCETLVLYKAGEKLAGLAELLDKYNLVDKARVVFYVEHEGRETVCENIHEAIEKQPGYMATVIIHINRKVWN